MHLRVERLVDLTLAEWAATDQEWFWEAYTALTSYRHGLSERQSIDKLRANQTQC